METYGGKRAEFTVDIRSTVDQSNAVTIILFGPENKARETSAGGKSWGANAGSILGWWCWRTGIPEGVCGYQHHCLLTALPAIGHCQVVASDDYRWSR